jgi:hypothetical protein
METPTYLGSLNPKKLMHWIGEMEKFFEFKKIKIIKKLKLASTNLKANASLQLDILQFEKKNRA